MSAMDNTVKRIMKEELIKRSSRSAAPTGNPALRASRACFSSDL